MTDAMELGEQARALLDSPVMQDVFNALENQYTEAWKRAETVEAREDFHRYVSILDGLRQALRSMALTAQLRRERLDKKVN